MTIDNYHFKIKYISCKKQGVPDWKANIPTMPGAYLDAVKKEEANSFRALDMGFREWAKLPRFRR
jgi:hypothetical protein